MRRNPTLDVYFIYTLLWWCVSPLLWLMMAWRAHRQHQDWQILSPQRFGRYNQPWDGVPPIWLHAVSVGEVRAATPLIRALIDQGERVLLTHVTPTGRDEGRRIWQSEIDAGQVQQRWVPYDFLGAMQGLIKHYQPRMTILIEREIWPNLVRASRLAGVPIVLASARLSAKSFKQTKVIDRLTFGLMRQTFATLDLVLAQTQADALRLKGLGAPHVQVTGNLKFDVSLPEQAIQAGHAWREHLVRPLVVIASTREGEDVRLLAAIKSYQAGQTALESELAQTNTPRTPRPLYVLIPRHPQRFETAAQHITEAGLTFVKWSILKHASDTISSLEARDVLLGDTMGEMPFFYAAARVAIVCGSFEPHGGQNFIEACAAGVPTIVGPFTENFAQAAESALEVGAIARAQDPHAALVLAHTWLQDENSRQLVIQAAQFWLKQHVGATQAMMKAIAELETQRALQLVDPH